MKKGENTKIEKWVSDNKCNDYVVSDKINGVSCLIVYDKVLNKECTEFLHRKLK